MTLSICESLPIQAYPELYSRRRERNDLILIQEIVFGPDRIGVPVLTVLDVFAIEATESEVFIQELRIFIADARLQAHAPRVAKSVKDAS